MSNLFSRVAPAVSRAATSAASNASLRLHLALAAVAYVPLLLTQRGWVSADTKTYLYLDPGKLLSRSWSMWDPSIGMGTVTHQSIGYLWPMGPFYWLTDTVGVPDWAAQRLWWGSIIFIAGAGVAYLLRTLGWRGPAITAATFLYALSPYLLTLVARLSAILLPFAALPWLLAFTVRTVRNRGWRYPALFALTVTTFGSVNATALLLVGLAPALWLVHSVWGSHEVALKTAARAAVRLAVLTLPVSAWWIAGLSVQGTNGIEILDYTETAEVVARVSVAHEVLRSLGYWFFYGEDRLGPWIESSKSYTQWLPLIAVTYLIPILGLIGAATSRWRHRAYFVALVLLGTGLAVGAHPWGEGPLLTRGIEAFLTSDVGLAMRSLPRAVPLVALGVAVLGASGLASLVRRWPPLSRPAGPAVAALAIVALPPLWLGQFVPDNLRRPEEIPDYWKEAAAHLDAEGDETRVLAIPGSDFASYRWGNTVDPILPGLMDRPSVARELIPYGSPASANLLNALDLRFQERSADPDAVAPIARLMRAGDVLVISDLQYERYNTPRPRNFWNFMMQVDGVNEPAEFGPGLPNETVEHTQLYDELYLATDPSLPDPPELAAFEVEDAQAIVSAHDPTHQVLVAGDGAGLVDAAGLGLIDGTELIHYSADLSAREIAASLDTQPTLLLTDTNRKQGERWTTVRHTRGYTETAEGGVLEEDLTDNRLPLFPDADSSSQTVAVNRSGIDAQATSYGNPVTYTGEERPALAVDGDPDTAWRTAAFSDARGERLELTLSEPTTTDHLWIQQPRKGSITRHITDVRLTFDGGHAVDVTLTPASRGKTGQVVTFPERTFETLSIEILADTAGEIPRFAGESSVGFAEVQIGDDMPTIDQIIRLPQDLLDAAGADSIDHPLSISMTRLRHDPTDVTRNDEERSLARMFRLPSERGFTLTGEAAVSLRADPHVRDAVLGRPHDDSVPWARSSTALTGTPFTAANAFDGDPETLWTSVRSRPLNQWIEMVLPEETTIGGSEPLGLDIVADGQHSVPTEIELWVDGEPVERVGVPEIEAGSEPRHTEHVELDIPEVSGSRFRLRLTGVEEVKTNDWVSGRPVAQPVAIAEIDLPAPQVPPLEGDTFDTGCRRDLLEIDGDPVPVRVRGPMSDAVAGRSLSLATCGGEPVDLDGGDHEVHSMEGVDIGIDINTLLLRSAAGGEASEASGTLAAEAEAAAAGEGSGGGSQEGGSRAPEVEIVSQGHDHMRVQVTGAETGTPFWLVQGQSHNTGWEATIEGGPQLDEPGLVNGFANGWLIVPTSDSFEVDLRFAPQQRVNLALWISVLAALGCLVLVVRRPRPAFAAPSAMPEPYSSVLAFRYHGALPTRSTALLTGLGVGGLAWLTAGVWVGAIVGAAAAVGARHEKFRRWLLLGSPAALGAAATYVLYIQLRHSPMPSFDWPIEMSRVHPLGWLAVWLMVADVVVGRVWQARSSEHTHRD